MFDKIIEWITQYPNCSHWIIFGAILLAGLNIPISIDLILIFSAVLAATVLPEHTPHLFMSVFFGCCISAWLSYWKGRLIGTQLLKFHWFSKILTTEKLFRIRGFYEKYGFLTVLVGRFIPFGVRNCIFMSTGISKLSFLKFALRDLIACFTWSSVYFYIFYLVGKNYQLLATYMKTINLFLFGAFAIAVIGFIWYKRRKTLRAQDKSIS